ncbi:hypothetical protein ABT119_40025 [Streptomyces sp. NPDC001910]|uniref:hypothetical protein n=1 Tax=Streptomyces sp. NPDC001910 TaxID=3154403 RepID=UPI00332F7275
MRPDGDQVGEAAQRGIRTASDLGQDPGSLDIIKPSQSHQDTDRSLHRGRARPRTERQKLTHLRSIRFPYH